MIKWYEKPGLESDIVTSTRIRLARNLLAYPFPIVATEAQKNEIGEKVKDAILSGNSMLRDQFDYVPIDKLSAEQAVSLVERHLASPELISSPAGKKLLISKDESIAVMINEEDHIRLQVMHEGFDLEVAFEIADRVDILLSERLDFAFDETIGYLTQCPTNIGTGMRASVMLSLPAMTEQGVISRTAENLSKLGLIIRGTYGEGTSVISNLYQLSNQITLGLSEKETVVNLRAITEQLIEKERSMRKNMCENIAVQDRIYRACGILQNAKILSANEFMTKAADIKLGISAGIIKGVTSDQINRLAMLLQPATMSTMAGQVLKQHQRDIVRAETVREIFQNLEE